jgi:hypothetical protein
MKCGKKDAIDDDEGGGDPIYSRKTPFDKSNDKNHILEGGRMQ